MEEGIYDTSIISMIQVLFWKSMETFKVLNLADCHTNHPSSRVALLFKNILLENFEYTKEQNRLLESTCTYLYPSNVYDQFRPIYTFYISTLFCIFWSKSLINDYVNSLVCNSQRWTLLFKYAVSHYIKNIFLNNKCLVIVHISQCF